MPEEVVFSLINGLIFHIVPANDQTLFLKAFNSLYKPADIHADVFIQEGYVIEDGHISFDESFTCR